MELKNYHKEELQLLLIAVLGSYAASEEPETRIYKSWIDRIRLALKDK